MQSLPLNARVKLVDARSLWNDLLSRQRGAVWAHAARRRH